MRSDAPAVPDPRVPPDPMGRLSLSTAHLALKVPRDRRVRKVRLDPLDLTEKPARPDRPEAPEILANLERKAKKAHQDLLDPRETKEPREAATTALPRGCLTDIRTTLGVQLLLGFVVSFNLLRSVLNFSYSTISKYC